MNQKLVLGLDLGVTSIGWALVQEGPQNQHKIIDLGVRLVPLSPDDTDEFTKGNAITKNQKRSVKRTMRRGLDRYQLRRAALVKVLREHNLMPSKEEILQIPVLDLWKNRAEAASKQITPSLIGRVLLHLNQRRGYQSMSQGEKADKALGDYVKAVTGRHRMIKEAGLTIGQYFYQELTQDASFRVREKVFPRQAYKEEFDAIWNEQKKHYTNILTDQLYQKIRNEILFYQRDLKSKKDQVAFCEFEICPRLTKEGKKIWVGPRVTPRSSPLFQVCKIWESINNLEIRNRKDYSNTFRLTIEQKIKLFNELNNKELIKQTELFSLLGISKNDGYYCQKNVSQKGIQGNLTKAALVAILGVHHPSLQFNLELIPGVNKKTGEVLDTGLVSASFEQEPLYRIWHIIYSVKEVADVKEKLMSEFGIDEAKAEELAQLDFTKSGFGDKSARFIRKILPHLMKGLMYSEASELAGYNHSNSETREDIENKLLERKIELLKKNALRQPIVEKILNQLVQVVNAIIQKHNLNTGDPNQELSEVRIELARELRQSKDERNDAYNGINKAERRKREIKELLLEDPNFRKKEVSLRDIERYRLWEEMDRQSPYEPGKSIGIAELYSGNYDIEHILPRSLHFDNSFSNKTICPRHLNSGELGKNRFTGYDFMKEKRTAYDFEAYINLIETQYQNRKISKTKYENLLRSKTDIPVDFINRQLNETRYITRKARQLLENVCRTSMVTIGSITDRLRELWGWDNVLHDLNLPKYKAVGLTEIKERESNRGKWKEEVIKGWSKRHDHRHHAIDALAVACTQRSFIKRINTLSSEEGRQEMFEAIQGKAFSERLNLLDMYLIDLKPFDTKEVIIWVEKTVVSLKSGKKVASLSRRSVKKGGKRTVVQNGIIEPRGPLSEESVYGKIKRKVSREVKLNEEFTHVDSIIDQATREAILARLQQFGNEPEKAFKDLKKKPVDNPLKPGSPLLKVVISDYQEEFVIRYPVTSIGEKNLSDIVDRGAADAIKARLLLFGNDPKKAYKDLENNPIWLNEQKRIAIKSVRCFTGLKADSIAPIRVFDNQWDLWFEKYVKPGNNHHIAIYKNKEGKLVEHVATFWHAVERKKYGIPIIISDPKSAWDIVLQNQGKKEFPESFLGSLPEDTWTFVNSLQQNECFVFNMQMEEVEKAIESQNYGSILRNLFRVRKLTSGSYWFNHILETTPRESLEDKKAGRCIQASLSTFKGIKVRVNVLGEISQICPT